MHRENIHRLIRTAIIEDRLPRSGSSPRVFGGRGDGHMCVCCHERIEPADVQYDVDCTLGGAVHTLFSIGRDERLNHRFEVEAGVRAEECAALLRAFFEGLRAQGKK